MWGSDPLALVGEIELERLRTSLERKLFRSAAPSRPTLGRFEILEKLGRGGMGTVYAARDPDLCRLVALKVLRHDLQDGRSAHRIMREARALARLRHPNVVEVYDVGDTVSGELFIAMEYIRGPTLRQWLMARERSRREIVEQFAAVGRGLAAAHAAGVIHRDFKPENVIIGKDGRPRVLDFGLAAGPAGESSTQDSSGAWPCPRTEPEGLIDAVISTSASDDSLVGTPAYMAPEQLEGGRADARSDQYAFCVALHEALLGERPFEARSIQELRRRVYATNRPRIPRFRLPRNLAKVLVRGLSRDPEQRFTTLSDLVLALEDALRPRSVGTLVSGAAACMAVAIGTWCLVPLVRGDACPLPERTEVTTPTTTAWLSLWETEHRLACERPRDGAAVQSCLLDLRAPLRALAEGSDASALSLYPSPSTCRDEARRLFLPELAQLHGSAQTQPERALELGEALLAETRRLNARETESDVALILARIHGGLGHRDEAEALLRASYFAAVEAKVHVDAARAAMELAQMLGTVEGRRPAALHWLDRAQDELERDGAAPKELRAEVLITRLPLLSRPTQRDAARDTATRLRALDLGFASLMDAERDAALGRWFLLEGKWAEAERSLRSSADKLERHAHPQARAAALQANGEALLAFHRHAAAAEHLRRSFELTGEPRVGLLLAETELKRQLTESARAQLSVITDELPPRDRAWRTSLLGRLDALEGNHAAAAQRLRDALRLRELGSPADPVEMAADRARLAISLSRMDDIDEAFAMARLAFAAAKGPSMPPQLLAQTATALGEVMLQSGNPNAAVLPLRVAREQRAFVSPRSGADTAFLLAQALAFSDPGLREEALHLCGEAEAELRKHGWHERAARIAGWVETRLSPPS